ncbi:MAG: diversity-generating retroelement protein Avd [Rhodobacterales bacterium]|nr:diversity-generating retroelement protein Avd [Rhodobacterales bacterium]
MNPDIPRVFIQWEAFTGWLLDHTAKFPRAVRQSLATRIDNLAFDVFEALIEARYDVERADALQRAGIGVEKLRLLLRLACERKYLSPRSFEYAIAELAGVGRQLGGWRRSL